MTEHSPLHRPPVGGEYYVFRDPIHNLIEIDNDQEGRLVRRILRTRELQRLRHISQNGLGRFVYQGLEGTRFPHSLGSYHVARHIIRSLHLRQPSPADFPASLRITTNELISFPIAALLHDIGHGPLSHLWEQYLSPPMFPNYNHEEVSLKIITSQNTELGRFLSKDIYQEFPQFSFVSRDVISFLDNSHRLYYLLPLLSGNLDVDRLDFMARDTVAAGVTYGFHDLDWIIRTFRFARLTPQSISDSSPTLDHPIWTVAIDGRKGLNTLNQFIYARENMYTLVYLHKTVRSISMLLQNIFRRAASLARTNKEIPTLNSSIRNFLLGQPLDVIDIVALDDNSVWEQIKIWASPQCLDVTLKELSVSLLARHLFKVFTLRKDVYETLQRMDHDNLQYLPALVSAKTGHSLDDSKYLIGFDKTIFNRVGREHALPQNNVWIIEEGIDEHRYTSLHEYYRRRGDNIQDEHYYLAVDERVVEEVNLVIEHLSQMSEVVDPAEVEAPANYKLLASLGKEGVWKSVYLGMSTTPGADDAIIVALKSYKTYDGVADAIKRDVIDINLLLSEVEGKEYLSIGRSLGPAGQREWLAERLWSSSLYDIVVQTGPMKDVFELLRLGRDLARGLAALHSKGIRHTDIKPENCGVLRSAGRVQRYVLGDFGCATTRHADAPLDPRLEGTQRTRAPEIFVEKRFSLAGDVWALGATIYAVATERYPFMGFRAEHGSEIERERRERDVSANMNSLLAQFHVDCEQAMPPMVFDVITECFNEVEKRASASHIASRFDDALAILNRLGEEAANEFVKQLFKIAGLDRLKINYQGYALDSSSSIG